MIRRIGLILAFALVALSPLSCAVPGGEVATQGPNDSGVYHARTSAARVGLPPAYRPFYDELESYGDWTLIEPYGWVFRPSVNFVAWRPYQEGWWEPSDVYGWVWNSSEPFGWIAYHYGSWFYDNYQGWVWQPGGTWAPSWVAWVSVGNLVGWAPLGPSEYDAFDRVPGGAFTFIPAQALAEAGAGVQASFVTNLASVKGDARAIFNTGHAGGTYYNRGPDPGLLSRLGAPMPAVRDQEELPRVRVPSDTRARTVQDLQSRSERAVAAVTRELRAIRAGEPLTNPGSPGRPVPAAPAPPRYKPGTPQPLRKPPAQPVARDSSRTKPHAHLDHSPAAPDSTKQ